MSAIPGFLMCTSNGSLILGLEEMSVIKRVSAIQGCPFRGVPMYVVSNIMAFKIQL